MSQELQRRRRAIATGLTPYMNEPLLLEAISLWQQTYAERPRFPCRVLSVSCASCSTWVSAGIRSI